MTGRASPRAASFCRVRCGDLVALHLESLVDVRTRCCRGCLRGGWIGRLGPGQLLACLATRRATASSPDVKHVRLCHSRSIRRPKSAKHAGQRRFVRGSDRTYGRTRSTSHEQRIFGNSASRNLTRSHVSTFQRCPDRTAAHVGSAVCVWSRLPRVSHAIGHESRSGDQSLDRLAEPDRPHAVAVATGR